MAVVKGLQFPYMINRKPVSGAMKVKADLFALLQTEVGLLLMQPSVGLNTSFMLFSGYPDVTRDLLQTYVTEMLHNNLPSVSLKNTDIIKEGNQMRVLFEFLYEPTNENLNIEYDLGGLLYE